jgi:hypothetical protein
VYNYGMKTKAPGFSVLRDHHFGVSKQNGSSVCGGLEPFPWLVLTTRDGLPKISPCPGSFFDRGALQLWSRNKGSTERNLDGVALVTQ